MRVWTVNLTVDYIQTLLKFIKIDNLTYLTYMWLFLHRLKMSVQVVTHNTLIFKVTSFESCSELCMYIEVKKDFKVAILSFIVIVTVL
jgi:hypothetical protein